VAAALSAQKEFTPSTLLAADKAVAKAETAADLRYSALSAKLDVLAARYENSSGAFTGVGNRNALLVNYFMSGLAIVVSAVVGLVYMFHR